MCAGRSGLENQQCSQIELGGGRNNIISLKNYSYCSYDVDQQQCHPTCPDGGKPLTHTWIGRRINAQIRKKSTSASAHSWLYVCVRVGIFVKLGKWQSKT